MSNRLMLFRKELYIPEPPHRSDTTESRSQGKSVEEIHCLPTPAMR